MFHVGQQVVAVGSRGTPMPAGFWEAWLRKNNCSVPKRGFIYTIRETAPLKDGGQRVRLVEIRNPIVEFLDAPPQEMWFWASAFRPVKPTSIEVFEHLLKTAPTPVRETETAA